MNIKKKNKNQKSKQSTKTSKNKTKSPSALKELSRKIYGHVLLLYIKSSDLQTQPESNKCYIREEHLEGNNFWMFQNKQKRADEGIQATSSSSLWI